MNTGNLPGHTSDYVEIFIPSVASVFFTEIGIHLKKRSTTIKKSSKPGFQVTTVVGFVSKNFKGQVVYSMSLEFAEYIAKSMLSGKLPVEQKKLLTSCVGELGNIISGKASIELAGTSSVVEIIPPIVLTGAVNTVDFYEVPTISLVMDSTVGALEINIAFQEEKK